ncbi:MAG: DUF2125 domain-containing protein [Pseudomonadota bacterium]
MRLSAMAFAAILPAAPVFAEVSADEVWEAWKQSLTVTSQNALKIQSEEKTADTLRLRGVTLSFQDSGTEVTWELGDLEFIEQSDGTVQVSVPASLPMSITVVEGEEEFEFSMVVTHEALAITASNATGPLVHDVAADSLAISFGASDELPDNVELVGALGVAGFSGLISAEGEDVRRQKFNMRAEEFTYDFSATEPSEGSFNTRMLSTEVTMSGSGSFPADGEEMNPALLIANPDYGVLANFGTSGTGITMDFRDAEGEGTMQISAGKGALDFALENGSLRYGGSSSNISFSGQFPGVPLPISASVARSSYDIAMPLVAQEEESDFLLGLVVDGLEIDPFFWNLFDPAEILARDPATVSLKIAGMGRWLVDILDPIASAELDEEDIPAEFSNLTISDLEVSVAGAQLTGAGDFTFDNSDLFTFDGFPAPSGALDLRLLGGNGLIDSLAQMGLLPQEQALGARMMMGLFMTPGEGEDEMTSKIEVQSSGEVFANGQRIR